MKNTKNVISEELALAELKSFIHKWVKKPVQDDKLADEYSDLLEAIMNGNLIIDSETKQPVYNLIYPIKNDAGNVSKSTIEFKTRIKPSTKADLADGLNLQKQQAKFSLRMIAYITGSTTAELDLYESEDYDVITQIAVVFM